MDTEIRAVIIGFGYMGRRHLHGYQSAGDVTVAGVSARTEATCEKARREFGLQAYRNIEELLDVQKPVIASICSPTDLHLPQAIECTKRGIHILVEKPIADTLENAQAMIEAAEREDVKLMAGHTNLYGGAVLRMLALVQKGFIGAVKEIYFLKEGADVSPGDIEKGIDKMEDGPAEELYERAYDDLVHMIYGIDKAAGGAEPDRIFTKQLEGSKYKEKVDSTITFESGITARVVIRASLDCGLGKEFRVSGQKGDLVWKLKDNRESVILEKNGKRKQVTFQQNNVFDNTVVCFVDFVRHDIVPYSDGRHGMRTMMMARAVVDSFLKGKEISFV